MKNENLKSKLDQIKTALEIVFLIISMAVAIINIL